MRNKMLGIFVCMLLILVISYPSLKSDIVENKIIEKSLEENLHELNQFNTVEQLGNWLDETYVVSTESDNSSYRPKMVVDHDRNIHIAWTESALAGQWYVLYKCLPNDATWDDNPWDDYPTELVSTESDPYAGPAWPTMIVDENGTVHIAWKDGTDINNEEDGYADIFYRQKSTGGNWIDNDYEQVSVEEDEESCTFPTMEIDSEGTIHIVWISNDYSSDGKMHYNYKPLSGDWTHTEQIGFNTTDYNEPELAIDESDNLYLVYTAQGLGGSGTRQVYYRNKTYAGTWSSSTLVSEISNEDSNSPKLALSTEDPPTVHVTWYDHDIFYTDEIFYRECDPVWNATEQVTDFDDDCEHPSIAVRLPLISSNHRVMVAYSQNVDPSNGEWHIQYMYKNVGDTWPTTYTTISDDATEFATSPDLCSERYYYNYRTHCAWADTTSYSGSDSDRDIVYKRTSPLVALMIIPDAWRGCAIAIENPQEFLEDHIPWWIDVHCKWFIFGQPHAEGVIDQIRPGETIIIKHSRFFGFGPGTIFAQADEAVNFAKGFIIGPFMFLQKNPQPGVY